MHCQWSGIATTDESGRTIYRCVNRIDGKSCTRVALGNREWQSICDLANVPRPEPTEVRFRGATRTSEIPCEHLRVAFAEEVGSCCTNETYLIDVGKCELHGRCEIFGRGESRPCCECADYSPTPTVSDRP